MAAKKKLSRDQKRKQKKQKRQQHRAQKQAPSSSKSMLQRLEEAGLGNYKLIRASPDMPKMSEVLMAFIEPYKKHAPTTEAMHKLITTALVAWNTALLPEEEQAQSLAQINKSLPVEAVEDFYAIVEEMIERKNRYFADYTRHILDYELTDTGDQYHISVVSTM